MQTFKIVTCAHCPQHTSKYSPFFVCVNLYRTPLSVQLAARPLASLCLVVP